MTQEELLQKLADIAHNKDAHEARNDYLLALRAVVELHKPIKVTHDNYKLGLGCSSPDCIDHYHEPIEYPCSTIQAIEKALS